MLNQEKSTRLQRKRKKEEGQALVEFALIAVSLLAIALIIFEAFHLNRQKFALDTVSREAARIAAQLGGGSTEVSAYINQSLTNTGLNPDTVTVIVSAHEYRDGAIMPITPGRDGCTYGEYIEVTLVKDWSTTLPFTDLLFNAIAGGGTFVIRHMDKCWRSSGE